MVPKYNFSCKNNFVSLKSHFKILKETKQKPIISCMFLACPLSLNLAGVMQLTALSLWPGRDSELRFRSILSRPLAPSAIAHRRTENFKDIEENNVTITAHVCMVRN